MTPLVFLAICFSFSSHFFCRLFFRNTIKIELSLSIAFGRLHPHIKASINTYTPHTLPHPASGPVYTHKRSSYLSHTFLDYTLCTKEMQNIRPKSTRWLCPCKAGSTTDGPVCLAIVLSVHVLDEMLFFVNPTSPVLSSCGSVVPHDPRLKLTGNIKYTLGAPWSVKRAVLADRP